VTAAVLLHAAVPAPEAARAPGRGLGLRTVDAGSVAALVGPVRRECAVRVALRHARAVAQALEGCSAVIPFRTGVEIASESGVRELLAENGPELAAWLDEASGLVEMGLKVRIPEAALDLAPEEPGLQAVRAVAQGPGHARERRRSVPGAVILEGAYLVRRDSVDLYWEAVDALRTSSGLRVVGTGPWPPYSFCDLSLRPAPHAAEGHSPGLS
jgi:hypothetical protein